MGVIVENCTVIGTRGRGKVRVRYDVGLRDSFVRHDTADDLGGPVSLVRPTRFTITDGQEETTAVTYISLNIQVDDILLWHWFYVMDGLAEELVAGADMIRKWKISLDMDNETASIDPRAESLAHRTGIAIPIPVSGE